MSKKLFMGVGVMVNQQGLKIENFIEPYIGWYVSEDEARGIWAKHIMNLRPGRLESLNIADVTEAAQPPL